jgi:hypothetical protein
MELWSNINIVNGDVNSISSDSSNLLQFSKSQNREMEQQHFPFYSIPYVIRL